MRALSRALYVDQLGLAEEQKKSMPGEGKEYPSKNSNNHIY